MIILSQVNRKRFTLAYLQKNKIFAFVILVLVLVLSLLSIKLYMLSGGVILDDKRKHLVDYEVVKIDEEYFKYIRDPQMLQLLGFSNMKNVIPAADKPALYNETNRRYFDSDWNENFIATEYDYPLKLPSMIYSNKHLIDTEKINYENCIILLLSEAASPEKSIKTIQSILDNVPLMSKYPVYLITGFFISDDNLVQIFDHFEKYNLEINIVRVTDVVIDGKMCGDSIDYLFSGISDYSENVIKENKNTRFNNDFENNYPQNLYKGSKKIKVLRQRNKGTLMRILEEYGTASIDFNKLQGFDMFQFYCFSNFDNFMKIKPGVVFTKKIGFDLFENMESKHDFQGMLAKFTNFRYSQRYRNGLHFEVLQKVYNELGLLIDSIFRNDKWDSVWKKLFSFAMKNIASYNRMKARIFNVVFSIKNNDLEDKSLFNGVLLDTQDTIFISKFKLFRSFEYDLFYKNFVLMSSIHDDSWIPNDPITLFLGLIKRHSQNENIFYRDDFELISDIEFLYDSTGNNCFDEIIHWNNMDISAYMQKDKLNVDFDLEKLIETDTLLKLKRGKIKVETTKAGGPDADVSDDNKENLNAADDNKENLNAADEEVAAEISSSNSGEKVKQNVFPEVRSDQRFISKYSVDGDVFFYKNHEVYEFLKEQFSRKFAQKLSPDEIEKLLNLFIYDNLTNLNKMFNRNN